MRIAYLCADSGIPLDGSKGASVHVRAVADALGRHGHDVRVFATRGTAPDEDFRATVARRIYDRELKRVKQEISDRSGTATASAAHGLLLNSCVLEALEAANRKAPFDAVYERYSLWSTAGMQFAARCGIPYALEVNAPLIDEQRRYRELAFAPAAEGIERAVMAAADVIFVPSRQLVPHVERRGARTVVVTPNAADLKRFAADGDTHDELPRPGPGGPKDVARFADRFVVAFVGSLKPWHGVEDLVAGFEKLLVRDATAHLLVIGDGPLLAHVVDAARRPGGDAVTVTGAVPHDEVAAWLRHASVGVAPYPPIDDFYFSPLKVFEYLAAGLPVVASEIGQLGELIAPGETGLLVPPGDTDALAGALAALRGDPQRRALMGRRARRRAEKHHGWDAVAAMITASIRAQRGRLSGGDAAILHDAGAVAPGGGSTGANGALTGAGR